MSAESLTRVPAIKRNYAGLSANDIFALLLAQQEGCPLLSGDKDLREAAESERIEVRGTLWLVEELLQQGFIDSGQALEAYSKMKAAGRRHPWAEARRRVESL